MHFLCGVFLRTQNTVEIVMRRFKQDMGIFKNKADGYRNIVKPFVTRGNCVNPYDIADIEISKFAFPTSALKQIQGKTTMGWTGFVAEMKDGKHFRGGTTFSHEFFQMPEGYAADDIDKIINHSYVSKTGEVRSHKVPFLKHPDDYDDALIFRERPFFACYLDEL